LGRSRLAAEMAGTISCLPAWSYYNSCERFLASDIHLYSSKMLTSQRLAKKGVTTASDHGGYCVTEPLAMQIKKKSDDDSRSTRRFRLGTPPIFRAIIAARTDRPKIHQHHSILCKIENRPKRLLHQLFFCRRQFTSKHGVLQRVAKAAHLLKCFAQSFVVCNIIANQIGISHKMLPLLCIEPVGSEKSHSHGLESNPKRGDFHERTTTTFQHRTKSGHS
jgi:hypothetical protein